MASALASQLSAFLDPGTTLPESDYARRPPVPRSAFEAYVRGVVATDPERKVSLLSDAIRLYPQYPAALYQLGQVYYLDSNYQESVALLEKVPTDVPEYALARFMLGMNYYHLEDFAKAAKAFTSLPPDYDVLVNLGAALYNS